MKPAFLDEIGQQIDNLIKNSGAQNIKHDIEKNVKVGLMGIFDKLDLVTRDEFDTQQQLLANALIKLQTLEAQIKALEEKANV